MFQRIRTAGAMAALLVSVSLLAAGCAGTTGWDFASRPGVPAEIALAGGGSVTGTLLEMSDGTLVIDTSVNRGEDVEVLRKGGVDYVYVRGVVVGTAVEVRDYDIVTRQRVPLRDTDALYVRARGYIGWGSAIAGALAFFLVKVLQEVSF
jgi:hypothetical protein